MTQVIVSYDGTRNDRDALALGGLFAKAGAGVTLAYVRHSAEKDAAKEAEAQKEAEHLLAIGAGLIEGTDVGQKVIVNPSTAEGLAKLAAELGADIIAFGSSHRTPIGRVNPPHTAQSLIERGVACSVAIATAGLRREPVERSIGTISVFAGDSDPAADATAEHLAYALGAMVTEDEADFLIMPSRAEATEGKLLLRGVTLEQAEGAGCPVLLLARGATLTFS